MKVVHLQYSSSISGNYTITLHNLMSAYGIESKVLSLHRSTSIDDQNILQIPGNLPKIKSNIDIKIQALLNKNINFLLGGFTFPILGTDISKNNTIGESDIIYIHWALGGFLNINSWTKLAILGKPIVFVLHDMFTFTGGCHHSFDCKKYEVECKDCQILQPSKLLDRANILFNNKLKFFQRFDNLFFIAPSIWMKRKAEASRLLDNKNINYIPNSVSPIFSPFDKTESKKLFGLSPKKKTIGFGANYVNSPYKGFKHLINVIHKLGKVLDPNDTQILVFGDSIGELLEKELPFAVIATGYLDNEKIIKQAYSAMDVFVVPSVAESGPITALESLQCGVPVVSFFVGGLPQMIDHRKNGFLANNYNTDEMAEGIVICLKLGLKGYLKSEYQSSVIINKHFQFFEEIKKVVL